MLRSDPLLIYKNSMNWLNQQLPSSTDWELLRSHSEDSNHQNPFVSSFSLFSAFIVLISKTILSIELFWFTDFSPTFFNSSSQHIHWHPFNFTEEACKENYLWKKKMENRINIFECWTYSHLKLLVLYQYLTKKQQNDMGKHIFFIRISFYFSLFSILDFFSLFLKTFTSRILCILEIFLFIKRMLYEQSKCHPAKFFSFFLLFLEKKMFY